MISDFRRMDRNFFQKFETVNWVVIGFYDYQYEHCL